MLSVNPPCPGLLNFKGAFFSLALTACVVTPAFAQQQVLTSPTPAPSTIAPDPTNFQNAPRYQTEWEDYANLTRGKSVDVIFIGDSITEQWRWGWGRTLWKKQFESHALDFGESGDTTGNVLWRLKTLDVSGYHPKVAVIMIGTNDIKNTADEIANGVKAVIASTQATFPGIKILLMSILPNARATQLMADANEKIKGLGDDEDVFYVDLGPQFTPAGDSWKGLLPDKLHLTEEGYAMWDAAIEPLLAKLLPASGY